MSFTSTVPSYQPETAYQIFMRTMFGKDVATGAISLDGDEAAALEYTTEGPASVFDVNNNPPEQPAPRCYVLAAPLSTSCTEEQIAALLDGSAVVENDVVISPAAVRS